jgi:hypothetical protein
VTVIQRCGSALGANVHFHTLAADGLFVADATGTLAFHPLPPPTDSEVMELVCTIRQRVLRLLERRGLAPSDDEASVDPLAEESPALAGITGASVLGRAATGARAGRRLRRVGNDPDAPWLPPSGPRRAHSDGFDLHADLTVSAPDRAKLQRLCNYVLRPPIAQERLSLLGDGRVLLELARPWSDGTTGILYERSELLECLAVMTPRPRINRIIYHGAFAGHARGRSGAVARAGQPPEPAADEPQDQPHQPSPPKRRYRRWADLMRRTWDVDVLECPRCGGRLRFIATIEDTEAIRRILTHLGLPTALPTPMPARSPPRAGVVDLFSQIEM